MQGVREIKLGGRPVQMPELVGSCIKAAVQALQSGSASRAVEATAAAAIADIQRFQETFLADAFAAGFLCDLYTHAFQQAGIMPAQVRKPASDPLRVAYVIGSLSPGQAATNRTLYMLDRHDRQHVEPMLFVAEELTRRTPSLNFLSQPDAPSPEFGRELYARARAAGVEPVTVPTTGTFIDGSQWLISSLRKAEPDVVVYVGTVASPIQACAAYARCAPVQINQNMSVPLLTPGIDAVIYHNAVAAEAERPELSRRGVRTCPVESMGTDTDAAANAKATERSSLGIPENAFVCVSASNKLEQRCLHGSFASDLITFLQTNTNAWWMAIGAGDFKELSARLDRAGVLERCVMTGPLSDIRPAVKAADVYLNEYPEGGANTVLESMACGVPAITLMAGTRHTECIGATFVGEPFAPRTIEAYWALVTHLQNDPGERIAAAKAQLERVRSQYSIEATCRAYEDIYRTLAWEIVAETRETPQMDFKG